MSDPLLVTIDGPAGVGKSTMAKQLAEELAIPYLDTGAMYRGVAWKLGHGAWDWAEEDIARALEPVRFALSGSGAATVLLLDGHPLGDEIRTEEVGMWASNVAILPVVRTFLKQAQQDLGSRFSLVAEGRDMGTVVFPDAPVKCFLDGSVEVRAQRRFHQLQEMGKPADLEALTTSIAKRDHQDRNRAVAPLRPADDATVIDTSAMTRDDVFAALLAAVRTGTDGRSASDSL